MTATTPQDLAEHALAASRSDGCVVLVQDSTSANLRWANNTLTTNGVMHGVSVTVVAFAGSAEGVSTGFRVGHRRDEEQVAALVEAADASARERARPRTPPSWWPARRRVTGSTRRLRPPSTSTPTSLRRWVRRSAAPWPRSGCSTGSSTTT